MRNTKCKSRMQLQPMDILKFKNMVYDQTQSDC